MLKSGFLLFVLAMLIAAAACDNLGWTRVTIDGSGISAPDEFIYICKLEPAGEKLVDSTRTSVSGAFRFWLNLSQDGCYLLKNKLGKHALLILTPGEKVTVTKSGPDGEWSVNGSVETDLYKRYLAFTKSNLAKVDSLSNCLNESKIDNNFTSIKRQLDNAYDQILKQQRDSSLHFIEAYPASLASLIVINQHFGPHVLIGRTGNEKLYLLVDSVLMKRYPTNTLVTDFHEKNNAIRNTPGSAGKSFQSLTAGQEVPAIELVNQSGRITPLKPVEGKLTLLYFWSSWDNICRETNLALTSLYSQFHRRGFEIYAISLDKDPVQWKTAISRDKAYWTQVSEPKGLDSELLKQFHVRQLPALFVLGKDGKLLKPDCTLDDVKTLIKNNL